MLLFSQLRSNARLGRYHIDAFKFFLVVGGAFDDALEDCMVLIIGEERKVRLSITHDVFPLGHLLKLLFVVFEVDVLQNNVVCCFLVECSLVTFVCGVDELRPKVNLKSGFQKERNIIQQETKSKVAEFVLDERCMI